MHSWIVYFLFTFFIYQICLFEANTRTQPFQHCSLLNELLFVRRVHLLVTYYFLLHILQKSLITRNFQHKYWCY